ncbi:peptidylprolyl isomerase [Nisaea sediminum]|uniref:peptidylprolyl isomerase n=1 Tax=Nisaea sediminum TaxID=2775867 RepID=UPI0018663E0E|nr:peptidylprolyl isomerase [Nisaea sediminum]
MSACTCSPTESSAASAALPGAITIGGTVISADEIMREAQNHPAEELADAAWDAARALTVRELLLQEADRQEPDGSSEGSTDERIRALIEREVEAPLAGEAECRRFYETNAHRFRSEAIYLAKHILLPVEGEGDEARVRAVADGIIAHLTERPGDFAAMATEYSACPSSGQGGSLGQITRSSVVPEFEEPLRTAEENALLPEPVRSRYGYHVIYLEKRIPGAQLPFEAVRERIAAWLEASSWSRAVSQYIGILAGRTEIDGIDLDGTDSPLVQ